MTRNAELFEAYRQTHYVVEGPDGAFALRIGEPSADLDRLMLRAGAETAVFITAYNPFSQPTAERVNVTANRLLERELRDCSSTILAGRGEGDDLSWPAEQSFLAIGVSRATAEQLGRKFRQFAIVWTELGRAPDLFILSDTPD